MKVLWIQGNCSVIRCLDCGRGMTANMGERVMPFAVNGKGSTFCEKCLRKRCADQKRRANLKKARDKRGQGQVEVESF